MGPERSRESEKKVHNLRFPKTRRFSRKRTLVSARQKLWSNTLAVHFEGDELAHRSLKAQYSDVPLEGETPEAAPAYSIQLSHLQDEEKGKVLNMLQDFESMWQGQLGHVSATEHHIDLVPGARPQYSQPYRAGPEKRKVIEETVESLLKEGVISPSNSVLFLNQMVVCGSALITEDSIR